MYFSEAHRELEICGSIDFFFLLWKMSEVLNLYLYISYRHNLRKFTHLHLRVPCVFREQSLEIPSELSQNSTEGSIKNEVSHLKSWHSSLHWSFVWSQKCLSTKRFSVHTDELGHCPNCSDRNLKALHSVCWLAPRVQSRSSLFPTLLWFNTACHYLDREVGVAWFLFPSCKQLQVEKTKHLL